MTFKELQADLGALTPDQLAKEVSGFDGERHAFWASHLEIDKNGHPVLQGTDDVGV